MAKIVSKKQGKYLGHGLYVLYFHLSPGIKVLPF